MYAINEKLQELHERKTPVRVGLIGAGQMGVDIIAQVDQMVGIEIPVVVDLSVETVRKGFQTAGSSAKLVDADDAAGASAAVKQGKRVATTNWKVPLEMPEIQVIIDATGSPEMGAVITLECIRRRKHIVMMNVECDVTVGPILRRKAEQAGIIYTLAAGDEPAAIMELYRFAKALGFTIVAAGKGKNNPLDIHAMPDALAERARSRNMSANMLCEFVDGSKTAIEMASVSNATGLAPDVRGMHGAKATVATLHKVFCTKKDGGVLDKSGVVDFAIGVHPGVFLVVTTDNARLRSSLIQRDMGDGPCYVLFRPFHLCSIEVPLTAAQTVIYGESAGHPGRRLVSECIAVAKRDLRKGEKLDGIGGACYRVSIDRAETARSERLLPAGLAKGCVLKTDIPTEAPITWDMLEKVPESTLLSLRREMDRETE